MSFYLANEATKVIMYNWFEKPSFDNGSLKKYNPFLLVNMLDCLGLVQLFVYCTFT